MFPLGSPCGAPGIGRAPMRTRKLAASPGENRVGAPKRKALGVESAGKSVGEGPPSGKAIGQREGFAGAGGGGSRRLGVHKPHLAGQRGNDRVGLGDPPLEVKQAGQALAEAFGDGVCGFAHGKTYRDDKDIAEPPAANGQERVGQDGMRSAAGPAKEPLNTDDFGGLVGHR